MTEWQPGDEAWWVGRWRAPAGWRAPVRVSVVAHAQSRADVAYQVMAAWFAYGSWTAFEDELFRDAADAERAYALEALANV